MKKNPNETIGKAATSYSELKKIEEKKLQEDPKPEGEKPAEGGDAPAEGGEKPAEGEPATPPEGSEPATPSASVAPAKPAEPQAQAQLTGQGTTPGRDVGELKMSHTPSSADEEMYNSLHKKMFGGAK